MVVTSVSAMSVPMIGATRREAKVSTRRAYRVAAGGFQRTGPRGSSDPQGGDQIAVDQRAQPDRIRIVAGRRAGGDHRERLAEAVGDEQAIPARALGAGRLIGDLALALDGEHLDV